MRKANEKRHKAGEEKDERGTRKVSWEMEGKTQER
jgi:hypothetical protein